MKPQWWKHYQTPLKPQSILEPLPETRPKFQIGDFIRLKDKPDKLRCVVDVRWHRYRHEFAYYVEISGDSWRFYWFAPQLKNGIEAIE